MEFTKVKYPRTLHMPWSLGVQSDDKVIKTTDQFIGKTVVLTEKMDGENTTMYNGGMHARSLDSAYHPSRDWVKRIWSEVSYKIPHNMRICGENLYAQHSVKYDDLSSYFNVFSVWDGDTCLSWNDTVEFVKMIGLDIVPVLYHGVYDEQKIKEICESIDTDKTEGAVLRIVDSFEYDDFAKYVMKYVRKGHVQTDDHWMHKTIIANGLKKTE